MLKYQITIADVLSKVKKKVWKVIKLVPSIKKKIDTELASVRKTFKDDIVKKTGHLEYFVTLPDNKLTKHDIMEKLEENVTLGKDLLLNVVYNCTWTLILNLTF